MDRAEQWLRRHKKRRAKALSKRRAKKSRHTHPRGEIPYLTFLGTKYWKRLRMEVLRRDKFTCKRCGAQQNLQAHHLTYVRRGHEKLEDLVTLCVPCHREAHRRGKDHESMISIANRIAAEADDA